MSTRPIATILLALTWSLCWHNSGDAADGIQIGIIQYNVKSGQGGWTEANSVLDTQVRLIVNQINSGAVDFIALEQAGAIPGSPGPIISDKLAEKGLPSWKTIVSSCNKDATQLAFSSNWQLVADPPSVNPLLNSNFPQRGWIIHGCEPHGDGRPYNIAYFQNKMMFRVLVVITHMPHCHEANAAICISHWNLAQFEEDIRNVLGTIDRHNINLIAVGDMNELGHPGDPNVFSQLFPDFGKLQMSPTLFTCCSDSNWIYGFDRILTNSRKIPISKILNDEVYPLNPSFAGHGEEHKAIYGIVQF